MSCEIAPEGCDGFTGSGKDTFLTPYSLNGYPPANGVEIHANSLVNLIEENWFNHLGREWESVIVATYGILVSLILVLLTPRIGILVAITLGLSVSILSILLSWETLTFYSWIVPAGIQTTSAYIWVIGTKYYQEIRRKIRLKKAFSAYLSPVMAQQVAESDISFSLINQQILSLIDSNKFKNRYSTFFSSFKTFLSYINPFNGSEI